MRISRESFSEVLKGYGKKTGFLENAEVCRSRCIESSTRVADPGDPVGLPDSAGDGSLRNAAAGAVLRPGRWNCNRAAHDRSAEDPELPPALADDITPSTKRLRRSREMTILCSPKVTQHHGQVNTPLPPGWTFLPTGKIRASPRLATLPVLAVFTRAQMSSRKLSTLRACGADDETAPRTPSAWMILLAPSLARGQIVFFGWLILREQKWVILAERRGVLARNPPPAHTCSPKGVKTMTFQFRTAGLFLLAARTLTAADPPLAGKWKFNPAMSDFGEATITFAQT